jgi:hypothetical protein
MCGFLKAGPSFHSLHGGRGVCPAPVWGIRNGTFAFLGYRQETRGQGQVAVPWAPLLTCQIYSPDPGWRGKGRPLGGSRRLPAFSSGAGKDSIGERPPSHPQNGRVPRPGLEGQKKGKRERLQGGAEEKGPLRPHAAFGHRQGARAS